MRVLFVQMFGMRDEGGSSRIFSTLIKQGEGAVGVLVHGLHPPRLRFSDAEFFVKERITFGRLERSRFASDLAIFRVFSWRKSRREIFNLLSRWRPDCVHAHIHGLGFKHAFDWCRLHHVPYSLSVHDDIRHLAAFDLWKDRIESWTAEAWREASTRFVISPEMGDEYSRRYGKRDWIQVTDGLDTIAPEPRPRAPKRLHVYFAGGLNVHYEPSFLAFQQGLKLFSREHPDWQVRFIVRGGRRLSGEDEAAPPIEVLPFGSQEEVLNDLGSVDLLYLPLSIDPQYANFAKFSLSTKMITYLGSGLPIFYHGPREAAAFQLLQKNHACFSCHSNDPQAISSALKNVELERSQTIENALQLGRRDFQIAEIRNRFWSALKFAGSSC